MHQNTTAVYMREEPEDVARLTGVGTRFTMVNNCSRHDMSDIDTTRSSRVVRPKRSDSVQPVSRKTNKVKRDSCNYSATEDWEEFVEVE